MSWLPRVPSLGRFSPFGGTPKQHPSSPAARVTDDDFSYITAEDIQNHPQTQNADVSHDHSQHHHHHPHSTYDHPRQHTDSLRADANVDPRRSEPAMLHKSPSYPQASASHLMPTPHHTVDGARPRSRSRAHSRSREPSTNRERLDRPARETDVLHFRHKGQILPVHFAAYAIDDGVVTVALARDHAARRLNVHDPKRLRMFWRGKNLKEERMSLRELGVKSADKTEIMVVIGHGDRDGSSSSSSDGEEESADNVAESGASGGRRKKRRGGGKKRSGKKKSSSGTESPAYAGPAGAGSEHLPIPSGLHPLQKSTSTPAPGSSAGTSPKPSRQPSPQPTTALGKLEALEEKFHTDLQPMAEGLINSPPREKDKRDFEHKKVTETIMTQVLLKVDGVETEGDEEARARRKALVKEVQGWLNKVDEVIKG